MIRRSLLKHHPNGLRPYFLPKSFRFGFVSNRTGRPEELVYLQTIATLFSSFDSVLPALKCGVRVLQSSGFVRIGRSSDRDFVETDKQFPNSILDRTNLVFVLFQTAGSGRRETKDLKRT